jgi:hypothetical protein
MALATRLLGLSSRVQAQRCIFQKTLPLDAVIGSTQEAARVVPEFRGAQSRQCRSRCPELLREACSGRGTPVSLQREAGAWAVAA